MATTAAPEAVESELRDHPIARTAIAVIFTVLVILSGTLFAAMSISHYPETVVIPRVIGFASTLVGFLGLIALNARWGYYLAILIVTAIPAVLAFGVLVLGMLLAWTAGVHTFASSWRPIGSTFLITAPFFAPFIVAGVLLLIRKCPTWVKILVAACGLCLLYATSLQSLFFVWFGSPDIPR